MFDISSYLETTEAIYSTLNEQLKAFPYSLCYFIPFSSILNISNTFYSQGNISSSLDLSNIIIVLSKTCVDELIALQEDIPSLIDNYISKYLRHNQIYCTRLFFYCDIKCSTAIRNDVQLYSIGKSCLSLPAGISYSIFHGEVFIGKNVMIQNSIISNSIICEYAAIIHCLDVDCNGLYDSASQIIEVGSEAGGRQVALHSNMEFSDCISQISPSLIVGHYHLKSMEKKFLMFNYIGPYSHLYNCSRLINCWIGPKCWISQSSISNCKFNTIDDYNSIEDRKYDISIDDNTEMINCILHSQCKTFSKAILNNVYMFEYSAVSEFARVHNTILGPDASIAGGECHNSLVGPFLGFHHQSLLIATIWPHGRGNIAYGAKIGANHSGRVNDQECFMGEGVFVGLGTSIKFPFNCIASPYSIIVPDSSCVSQVIKFPFSLISNNESESMYPYHNLIKPGWLLWGNAYFIERSAMKFVNRRKAKCHMTDYPIYRPYIIDMIKEALKILNDAVLTQPHLLFFVFDKAIASAKDVMKSREEYLKCLKRYALQIFVNNVIHNLDDSKYFINFELNEEDSWISDSLIASLQKDIKFSFHKKRCFSQHQLNLLYDLYPSLVIDLNNERNTLKIDSSVLYHLLIELYSLEKEVASNVQCSRDKDGQKADEIIPDYNEVNSFVRKGTDDVIQHALNRIAHVKSIISRLFPDRI